jgi:hypothetical protein
MFEEQVWSRYDSDVLRRIREEDDRLLFSEKCEEDYLFGTGRLSCFRFICPVRKREGPRLFPSVVIRERLPQ